MARTKRPQVILPSVASHYAMEGERIAEISSDAGGCLISLRVISGRLRIEVYRADDTVDVVAPTGRDVTHTGHPRTEQDERQRKGY